MSRIPPELEAEMTPAVKRAFLALLDRIEQLEAQIQKLTPRNSSVPPSTEHPHARPKPKPKPASGKKRKRGGLKWSTFQSYVRPIHEEVRYLLLRGKFSGNAKLIGFCNALYDRREHLWTFTRVEGIEPTNNTAERALRPTVIYRKLSFGTQSASGSRYLERLLTVSETCRLQDRNAYHYLIEAMEAKFAGQPAPSLLPQPEPPDASAT